MSAIASKPVEIIRSHAFSAGVTMISRRSNLGANFEAVGARQEALSGLAGMNNHVAIELHGVSKQIDVLTTPSVPVDPTGNNTVSVIR